MDAQINSLRILRNDASFCFRLSISEILTEFLHLVAAAERDLFLDASKSKRIRDVKI
jgi:hypothetical protein